MGEEQINRSMALVAVAIAQFMVVLDMSIVNVALPSIGSELHFDSGELPWVVNAYALLFGGFLLLGGRAADLYGQRRILLGGSVLFALASLAGGLAQNPEQLIGARALQGLGAAAMAPAALAVLTITQREGRERARALGVYSAMGAVGGSAGVIAGGLLTEYASWRWVMLVNLPMAVAVIAFALRNVPTGTTAGRKGRLDLVGAVLATGGVGLLIFGMVRTDSYAWDSPTTLITLTGAVVLLILFLVWERRPSITDPLVRLGLFRRRPVAGSNLFMLLLSAAQFASFYFLSLYLQRVLRLSTANSGLGFLPMCVTVVSCVFLTTRLLRKFSEKAILVPAGLAAAGGLFWFSMVNASGSYAVDVLGPSILVGIGIGACNIPITGAATVGLPRHEAGMASALLNSSRQVGGAIGLAALVTAQVSYSASRLAEGAGPDVAATDGYGLGFLIASGCFVVAVLLTIFVLPSRAKVTTARDEAAPAAVEETTEELGLEEEAAQLSTGAGTDSGEPVLAGVGRHSSVNGGSTNGHGSGQARFEAFQPVRPGDPGERRPPLGVAGQVSGVPLLGSVRRRDGSVVARALLTLIDQHGHQVSRGTSAGDGSYQVMAPGAGTYVLIVTSGGFQPQASSVVLDGTGARVTITLTGTGALRGVARMAGRGTGVSGVTMTLTDTRGEVVGAQMTTSDGGYVFDGVGAGGYTLVGVGRGFRPVAVTLTMPDSGELVQNIELTGSVVLTGTTRTDGDRVVPDARIAVLDADGAVAAVALSDQDGHYRISDLPEGQYTVVTSGYPPASSTLKLTGHVVHDVRLGYDVASRQRH